MTQEDNMNEPEHIETGITPEHQDLLTVTNAVLQPHIASASLNPRRAMANLAADNLIQFLTQGKTLTPLNPEVLLKK